MAEIIRILIVEDHAVTRVGIALILRDVADFELVGEVGTGHEAIEESRCKAPNVVLMDIRLPDLDGIKATAEIKKYCPDCRVLILTGHMDDEQIFAAFDAGADGYCLKDTSKDQLQMAIRSVHSGAAWLDPAVAQRVFTNIKARGTKPSPRGSGKSDDKPPS